MASRVTRDDGEDVVAVDANAGHAVGDALVGEVSRSPSGARPGTLMAQPLLRQKKTTGALKTPAKFIPLWKSVELVAPSPK